MLFNFDSARSRAGAYLTLFSLRILSFPSMLASLLVGAAFIVARPFGVDPDMWWHVKVGDTLLATHHWPTTEPYSFTVAGQPWIAHEWLGDALFAGAFRLAGFPGLEALFILLGSATLLALYALATTRSGNAKGGFVAVVLLLTLASALFSMRPQMLGYLFLILMVIALERFRLGKRKCLWFLPILMLIWVNTHASWIVGMGTLLVYWLSGLRSFQIGNLEGRRWTPHERTNIAWVFLLSLIALPMTPYGTQLLAFPFEAAFSLPLSTEYINEYKPMPFNLLGGKIFLAFVLAIILAQVLLRVRWRLEELALFLFGTMMACLHVRFLLIFVPFAVSISGAILSPWIPAYDHKNDKYVLNGVIILITMILIVRYYPTRTELQESIAKRFPVGAVAYLKQHPVPEPMFNNSDFGTYLLWSRPGEKVFMDGRSEVYERSGTLGDYLHIANLKPGALTLLYAYHIQSCLLRSDEPLSTLLSATPGWKRVYVDEVSALFVHVKTPPPLN
jgi:hypothetical protein